MGKLAIDCLNRPKNLTEIAKAVYDTLRQVDNLKAEIIYMNESDMQALNKETRGIDKVTDVLSYPTLDGIKGKILKKEDYLTALDGRYIFIGSIVLCKQKIKEQAQITGAISYLGFINDCINELKSKNEPYFFFLFNYQIDIIYHSKLYLNKNEFNQIIL